MTAPPRIAVVDYGAGNLRSVAKALERSGFDVEIVADADRLRAADAVALPGVGAFSDAMGALRARGLDLAVREHIEAGRPYLGLCLGLQLLFEESEEHGRTAGLGLMKGRVELFPRADLQGRPLRVPHIGWNSVRWSGAHPVSARLPAEGHYYFVHGYRVVAADPSVAVGCTDYGGAFASAVARENVFAVQFHPEKSQDAGRRVLDAFAAWMSTCA
jgi:glutamine amidotransferase